MTRGFLCGDKGCGDRGSSRLRLGIDLFIEDAAYTTLASAVAILVVLTLVFSAATAVWTASRAGDVQVAADTTALAGANVVSSYHTVATVLDASILSLGLAGFAVTGVGLVGLLIPGVNKAAEKAVDAGIRILKTRNDFAKSASKGLEKLEKSLPYLVAANGTRTCLAQATDSFSYAGTALALPRDSASDFPALEGEEIRTDGLENAADDLDEIADELAKAAEESAAAKEAAWIADCGRDGMNMQERADRLSGISAADNPDFASSITWDPSVAIDRTRAYYRWRYDHDVPEGSSTEAKANAAARHAFYGFACEQFADATFFERNGTATSTVPLLPKNTAEVRSTSLYTDAVWPSTNEASGLTLHYGADCPGAAGTSGPLLALAATENGSARECSTCRFGVGDVGKTPAASTSIDNGFEYHLREFTLALRDYAACRNRELELERRAKDEAESAGNLFEEALSVLAGKRPRIAPPGRNGCVALVVAGEASSPEQLDTSFSASARVGTRGAISAAVLASDSATRENNVLASFFSSLESHSGGGGAVGLIGNVMDLWGNILMSYGDLSEGLDGLMDKLLGGLSSIGAGPIADWLSDRIDSVVTGLGFEPVDLSLRKPVLTDTGNVIRSSGMGELADAQNLLRSIPLESSDPEALLGAVGYRVGEHITSMEFTVATIPLPGGGSIPLTVRVRDLVGVLGGGS